jgi:hypothetical protein
MGGEPPDDQRVPGAKVIQPLQQSWAVGPCPGAGIAEDPDTSSTLEGIRLQVEGLVISRDTGVANLHRR